MTAALAGLILVTLPAQEVATEPIPPRPKVPGVLRLHLRERSKEGKVSARSVDWRWPRPRS